MGQSTFLEFARGHLPPPPARVLDVGCGQGDVTTSLAVAGYDVLGIDPAAPDGDLFRRVLLEDLEPEQEEPFDAVVASLSLHHVRDLDQAVTRIGELLRPRGALLLDEFAWDLADDPTLDWFYNQWRVIAAASGHGEVPTALAAMRDDWETSHLGLHRFAALRAAVAARFEERAFGWTPFLYRLLDGVATEVLEQALVDSGAIRPLGFRYAGVARSSEGGEASPESGSHKSLDRDFRDGESRPDREGAARSNLSLRKDPDGGDPHQHDARPHRARRYARREPETHSFRSRGALA